ncbi:MAG: UvrD-helicase domain-containing protein [Gammaproteobacteria bacterium]
MKTPGDAGARMRALDIERSFIVQAPAGSGKTELLTQRFLGLLACVERPEEVIALTFTLKATGEMRARILEALESAREPEPPAESWRRKTWSLGRAVLAQNEARGWRIEEQPSRLRILTLDALCALLARQMPYLSQAGAGLRIAEPADELYAVASRRLLEHVAAGPVEAAPVERLLYHLDNGFDRAARLLAELLAKRDHWLRLIARPGSAELARERLENTLQELVRRRLQALCECIPAAQSEVLGRLAGGAAARLAACGMQSPILACRGLTALPTADAESLPAWHGIAELLLKRDGQWRKQVDVTTGFPPDLAREKDRMRGLLAECADSEELRLLLLECRRLPPGRYTEEQWSMLASLFQILPLAAAELELVFRERGEADFIALAQAALRALGDDTAPTDLALALDYRMRHILVDEFQDTSHTQFELLRRLTAGWEPGDGRTLFLVGDPTQSIYGFREAEVGLFLAARQSGIGDVRLEPLNLTANFRSQRPLVDWANETFGPMLPAQDDPADGAVAHVRGEAVLEALEGEAVSVHAAVDEVAEAGMAVSLVQAARREDPAQRIAVLVRARRHLEQIAPRLAAAGIRFQAVEIEPLGRRPAIGDLLALTRAMLHFADRAAWLAILRAPWCGVSLTDLHALAAHAPQLTIRECMRESAGRLSADGAARLERVQSILAGQLAERGRFMLRDWVEQTWLALGGPATLTQRSDLANAAAYFDLLQKLEDGGDLADPGALESALENLYAAPDPLADDKLQLMTIHKAKGLEFDVVILPGLDRQPDKGDKPLLHWLEIAGAGATTELVLAPIGMHGGESDPLHSWISGLRACRGRLEAQRLLYVAATRARRRLHLLGRIPSRKQEPRVIGKPRVGTFLEFLWPALCPTFEDALATAGRRQAAVPQRSTAAVVGIRRLRSDWRAPAAPPPAAGPIGMSQQAATLESPPYDWAGESARRIGTVVHRALQQIAEGGVEAWNEGRLAAFEPVVRGQLAAEGLPAQSLAGATSRVLEALRRTLRDERGRWILGGERRDARCEFAVTGRYAGRLVNAVIDRSFVDEDGVRWVVDYKSSRHEGGALDAFLASELERYGAKLDLYAILLRQLDDRPVRTGLYFPMLGEWREWTPSTRPPAVGVEDREF